MKRLVSLTASIALAAGALTGIGMVAAESAQAMNVCTTKRIPPVWPWYMCAPLIGTTDYHCQWTTKTTCTR
jgi:hypothetical protein